MNSKLQTYSGFMYDPFNPDPKLIRIEEIAHSLALQNRFLGHTKVAYHTAQHSFYVSVEAITGAGKGRTIEELRILGLLGLLHDGGEIHFGDMPRPLKVRPEFAFYRQLEMADLVVILGALGLPNDLPLPEEVVKADHRVLATEARDLMEWSPPEPWDLPEPACGWHIPTPCWDEKSAEALFLERWHDLRDGKNF